MTPAEAGEHLDALELFLGGLCARQWLGDHICLAEQPRTPFGSPDELVDRGVSDAATITGQWGQIIVNALAGATTEGAIRSTLAHIGNWMRLDELADAVHEETLRGALLGSADSQWERVHGIDVAPAKFDDKDQGDISGGPHAAAIKLWSERKVLSPEAFHALDAGMRRRAFTVAGMAKQELLDLTHAEFGRMLAAGAKNVKQGPNLREFSRFVDERLKTAGWTPANPSHVETIFRTNVMSAYSAGRHAEMTQPHVIQAMPYWQIRGVTDSRARPTHHAANGVILPATHSFWKNAYPPFGFNCRCRVCARSRAWVLANNVKLGPPPRDLPDPGFRSGTSTLVQVPQQQLQAPTPNPVTQPVAEPTSTAPMVVKAPELAAALEREDGRVVRSIVREQIGAVMPGATSKDVDGRRAGADSFVANDGPAKMGARAFHDWKGCVVVDPEVKAASARAAAVLGQYAAITPDRASQSDYNRMNDLNLLRTVVHEELHGYSRTTMFSYNGIGRILEEVGTELSARHIVREAAATSVIAEKPAGKSSIYFNVRVDGRNRVVVFGSYPLEIDAVTNVVASELGITETEAQALIRKAHATHVCGRGFHFNSKDEHLDAFVHGLDQSAEKTQAIRTRLLQLESSV